MLVHVEGDILMSSAEVIAHGVAPDDHFNQGLALALRKDYPAMAKDFRHFCKTTHPKPGELWTWPTTDGRRIVNLLTQEPSSSKQGHPGKASLQHVRHALRNLSALIDKEQFNSVALSRLATGVGGLSWEDVLPLIEKSLGNKQIPVYLYGLYRPGVRANEVGLANVNTA